MVSSIMYHWIRSGSFFKPVAVDKQSSCAVIGIGIDPLYLCVYIEIESYIDDPIRDVIRLSQRIPRLPNKTPRHAIALITPSNSTPKMTKQTSPKLSVHCLTLLFDGYSNPILKPC